MSTFARMKNLFVLGLLGLIVLVGFVSCQKEKYDGKCHITGTVVGEQYEGKRIFLVPFEGPATAETVDSMEITNGTFHFEPDSVQMYKILLDYHFRMGLQPLLVIGEPGTIEVTIDSISSAHGTPQNDSLETWKKLTEEYQKSAAVMRNMAKNTQDTVQKASIEEQLKIIRLTYRVRSRQIAGSMEGTVLGNFLTGMFPKTYKKEMPDGSIVEIDTDTNEPIQGKSEK